MNIKRDSESETSYSGWTQSIHWTDMIEVAIAVLFILVIARKVVTWVRNKNIKKKHEKMEDLRTVLSQQPQQIPQSTSVPQGFPLVIGQCPRGGNNMGENDRVSITPSISNHGQVVQFNKSLYE